MKKDKKVKGKLKVIMQVTKEVIEDKSINGFEFAFKILVEKVMQELDEHNREISKAKRPVTITVEIKTRKKK